MGKAKTEKPDVDTNDDPKSEDPKSSESTEPKPSDPDRTEATPPPPAVPPVEPPPATTVPPEALPHTTPPVALDEAAPVTPEVARAMMDRANLVQVDLLSKERQRLETITIEGPAPFRFTHNGVVYEQVGQGARREYAPS